jgi:hypothetical protein
MNELTQIKSSTLGASSQMPVSEATPETSQTVVTGEGTLSTDTPTVPEPQAEPQAATATPESTDNNYTVTDEEVTSNFNFPTFDENGQQVQPTEQAESKVADWRTALKQADPKEVLKELGFDDFTLEFAEYRKNGGDPYAYLEAKSLDWNKVPDDKLVMDSLKSKYPNMDEQELKDYFNYKYKQGEFDSDEEKRYGSLTLKAEASEIRQQRIAEQQRFKVPVIEQAKPSAEQLAQEQKIKEENEKLIQYVNNHESTKALLNSKRVAIKLPDGIKPFNYNVDPKVVLDALYNPEAANKYGRLKTGEPDVQLAYELALFKMNPEQFKRDLINIGKGIGHRKEVEEAQNIKKPTSLTTIDNTNQTLKDVFASQARSGTLASKFGIGS